MDDFNTSVLSEAKNEYSSRLVNILSPLILQGFKAIFKEAWDLCIKNEEEGKYLMTFQNFLTRVPKWNQEIINVETSRIVEVSKCKYLEDLLTCVHITQLKILTSIRVSSKQKKIDIDIPKLHDYIHKVYISAARKLYQNVYLFEENIYPLAKQKNFRECEIIIKEAILNVIRESMPIEKILRAYMDETVEEEVVEEIENVPVVDDATEKAGEKAGEKATDEKAGEKAGEKTSGEEMEVAATQIVKDGSSSEVKLPNLANSLAKMPAAPPPSPLNTKLAVNTGIASLPSSLSPPKISFNDKDNIVKYSDSDDPIAIANAVPEIISAPKTIERLEKISTQRSEQRKQEEAEEDDAIGDSIKIFKEGPSLKLNVIDVQDISNSLKINNKPDLTGVEVLA